MSAQATDTPTAKSVFRYPCRSRTIVLSSGVVSVAIFRLMYQTLELPSLVYWIMLFLFVDLVGQAHRKIEISEHEVAYRPMF